MVVVSIFLFAPVLAAFPQAALAGVVVYAGLRLVDVKDELGIKSLPVNHSVVELVNGVRRYRVDAAPEMNFHSLPQVVRARGVSEP